MTRIKEWRWQSRLKAEPEEYRVLRKISRGRSGSDLRAWPATSRGIGQVAYLGSY